MVSELRELLRETADTSPLDQAEVAAVLRGGRRRVRRRRVALVGGAGLATAAVVVLTSVVWPAPPDLGAAGVPRPDAPTLRLTDARDAVEGQDYRVLASYTNDNLDRDNGQYFAGVTDDGLVLFNDAPDGRDNRDRYALMDPATGEKEWLPLPSATHTELAPVHLGAERLVFTDVRFGEVDAESSTMQGQLLGLVHDRRTGESRRIEWAGLPDVDGPGAATMGPDGRLYVRVPASQGQPPPGGWPIGAGGEADDADAEGDTYALWSVSPTDPEDVRDEQLTVGDVAFTDSSMVWTDATNGDAGQVHVRDLGSGEERAFDPRTGERCNLLSFGVTDDLVVMGQYCGTYAGEVRDDRVQVLTTEGDQVVTVQDSGIDGGLAGDSGLVTLSSYARGQGGSYVYDPATERFLRLSESTSKFSMGGPTPAGLLLWDTPVNRGHGATQLLGELSP